MMTLLALPQPGAPFVNAAAGAVAACACEPQQLAQGEAENGRSAEPQQIAPGQLGVCIAEIGIEATGETNHGGNRRVRA
jgi:hypothetical protein